jgi:hypothetical protein
MRRQFWVKHPLRSKRVIAGVTVDTNVQVAIKTLEREKIIALTLTDQIRNEV